MSAPHKGIPVQRTEAPNPRRQFRVNYRAGGIGTTIVEASSAEEAAAILKARFENARPCSASAWNTDVAVTGEVQ